MKPNPYTSRDSPKDSPKHKGKGEVEQVSIEPVVVRKIRQIMSMK